MEITKSELDRIEYEVLRLNYDAQQFYYDMVANGQNPRFALMCACKQAPGTRYTDKTFNMERRDIMNTMNPKQREDYLKIARKSGISTQGKYYVGAFGRPNDPRAWVSTVDEATAVCRDKNLTADGIVKHRGSPAPPKKVRMAPDVRDGYVARKLASDPSLASKCAKDRRALRRVQEEVVDRHAPPCTS